jgi:hypothetical protein
LIPGWIPARLFWAYSTGGRVLARPCLREEWGGLFIALAMCGGASLIGDRA